MFAPWFRRPDLAADTARRSRTTERSESVSEEALREALIQHFAIFRNYRTQRRKRKPRFIPFYAQSYPQSSM
ncbi:hypothetical protein O5173_26515 [Escherichia coli]|nr:hypothetical protein [Escherichia coli]